MRKIFLFLIAFILYSSISFAGLVVNPVTGKLDRTGSGSGTNKLSALVIYASKAGCALNSNLTTGGGTDDSACLQTQLDTIAANAAGGELIIDGVALVSDVNVSASISNPPLSTEQSTALKVGNNTTIRVIPGGGVFLKAASNCPILGNLITGAVGATYQHDISIIGGTWNGNVANQTKTTAVWNSNASEPSEQRNGNNWLVMGFWFGSVDKLTIKDLVMKEISAYQIYITNATHIVLENINCIETSAVVAHQDCYHFGGDITDVYGENLTCNGNDDSLTFNTDEEYYWGAVAIPTAYGVGRFPQAADMAQLKNATFKNIYFKDDGLNGNGIRFFSRAQGGSPSVDNVFIQNVYGNLNNVFMQDSRNLTFGKVTIDGWYVTGASNIVLGANLSPATDTDHHITLNNIVFADFDNTATPDVNQPINIYGGGQVIINGVLANATTNPTVSNELIGLSGTNSDVAVSNVITDSFSYLARGGSSTTNLVLSNVFQKNALGVGFSLTTKNIRGDINLSADTNGNVGIGTSLTTNTGKLSVFGGNVGIGTRSPGQALDVTGTIRSSSDITIGSLSVCRSDGTNCPAASASPGGGTNAIQYNNGSVISGSEAKFSFNGTNIGIGTSNANQAFDIRTNVGIGTSTPNHTMLEVTGDGSKDLFRINDGGQNDINPALMVTVGGAGGFGNVGVGTTTPLNTFFVSNTPGSSFGVNGAGTVALSSAQNTNLMTITGNSLTSGAAFLAQSSNTGFTTNALINGVLSGNNAGVTGVVANFAITGASSAATGLLIDNRGTGSGLVVYDQSSDPSPFIVDAAGNVGIGTSTANIVKLDVAGTIRPTAYWSSDNSPGVTVTTCTGFKNGLCISGT